MGWHSKGGHDRTFGTNAKAWDWCSVNNAGFEYYQNAKKDGIGLPPHNPRIWFSDINPMQVVLQGSGVYGILSVIAQIQDGLTFLSILLLEGY